MSTTPPNLAPQRFKFASRLLPSVLLVSAAAGLVLLGVTLAREGPSRQFLYLLGGTCLAAIFAIRESRGFFSNLEDSAGRTEMRTGHLVALFIALITGIMVGRLSAPAIAHAQFGPSWRKSEVLPVVIVKPDIGGFSPTKGSSIGNTWRKDQVVPMCLVKPDIFGFTPVRGSSIGNSWPKDEVRPFVLVEPNISGFSPSESPVMD